MEAMFQSRIVGLVTPLFKVPSLHVRKCHEGFGRTAVVGVEKMLGMPFVKVNSVGRNVGGDHGVDEGLVDDTFVLGGMNP
eukprot:scaffold152986_cov26-Attheya_sp.AAC.1